MMKSVRWNKIVITVTIFALALFGLTIVVIDPFWHYHKGISGLEYPFNNDRYVNDGLQRNCDYEQMIIGTSMVLNFNASTAQELWNVPTIKTGYSGASFHELSENIAHAIKHNKKLKRVICSFDTNRIVYDANAYGYEGIPFYLYDDNPFNDVQYFFNKNVFTESIAVINYTLSGQKTPSMDEYGRFDNRQPTGKQAILNQFTRNKKGDFYVDKLTQEDIESIKSNISDNYLKLAKENPDVEFIFFYTPYSIYQWDSIAQTNQIHYNIEIMRYAAKLMLAADNILLYSFDDRLDIVENINHYSDVIHYDGEVADIILQEIYNGVGRITTENCDAFFDRLEKMYTDMDYEYLFE